MILFTIEQVGEMGRGKAVADFYREPSKTERL
jgi:hypothetical protein